MTVLADQRERNLIATALDRTIVVEAAAGTGKTTELVNRIISVLAEGHARIGEVVAVTFTDKAAGELRLRLRSGLETSRRQEQEGSSRYANLLAALGQLEEAQINTIHGFCADLLRERPVEAMLDPQFESINESQAKLLQREAFKSWLQRILKDPPEGVRRYLRRDIKRGPADSLYEAASKLALWRDYPAPWRRPEFECRTVIDSLVEQLQEFAQLTGACSDAADRLYLSTLPARRFADQLTASEAVAARDYDSLEAQFVVLHRDRQFREPQKGRTKKYGETISRAEVVKSHEQLIAALEDFVGRANADLAALLHSELQGVLAVYEESKLRLGRLDFLDLLLRARNLLRENNSVRADLQKRFNHIFVDEFQDTDPIQAEILLLLACGDPCISDWENAIPKPGKLFIVGDPKQAVYRFRRADVGVYQHVKRLLEAHGALCINLTTSFRGRPSIQRFVNAVFEPVMKTDTATLQTSYVPLSPYREEGPDQPSIVALPVPDPYGQKYISGKAVDSCLPDAVGAFAEWLIKESGWRVNEGNAGLVPIRPDHICILLRRFESYGEDKARAYAQALEARDIPHLLIGGRSFHQREEVETIRAALTAIEWPDDELSVFATLRGSLFTVGDEPLLRYRTRWGRLHPFRVPQEEFPEDLLPIKEALIVLQELHKQRNRRSVAESLNRLLEATRAHAGFAMRPSGEQVLANVLHICELARSYEASGGISFRGFIEQLEEDAERGQVPEAPILEEGSEGVRIMTVHKAKGLEFPIVILGGITAPLAHEDADCYIDGQTGLCALQLQGLMPLELLEHQMEEAARNRAEGVRIAYVASTRARDLLVVPAVADDAAEKRFTDPHDWWIAPIFAAMFPSDSCRNKPHTANGCPAFGRETVLRRPADQAFNVQPIRPGKYVFPEDDPIESSQYSVVWWDPSKLGLGKELSFAVRQEELLAKVDDGVVNEDLRTYEGWRSKRTDSIERGSQPSIRIEVASRRARRRTTDSTTLVPTEVIYCEREEVRPKGPRFGALVHSILATIPFDGEPSDVEATAFLQGRIFGATKDEVSSARLAAERALAHPILQRARQASKRGECRRETPVTLLEPDGTLVEGVVDLAFAENGQWLVLDFKTDQEVEQALNAYSRQVALYADAVAKAIGQPSRGILMVV